MGSELIQVRRLEVEQPELAPSARELEQSAGEFIARQVLNRDAAFFEG